MSLDTFSVNVPTGVVKEELIQNNQFEEARHSL
ncbi:hypothetical protein LINPERPRIM_LOCUS39929 [Linum perenne]